MIYNNLNKLKNSNFKKCKICNKKSNNFLSFKKQPLNNFLFKENLNRRDLNYFYCKNCLIIFKNYLSQKEINMLYSKDNKHYKYSKIPDKEYFKYKFILSNTKKRLFEVLEIGAGNLFLFETLKKSKKLDHYTIVDPSMSSVNKDYLHVINKKFEDVNFKQKFDLIICRHMIEHINNPLKFLKNLNKLITGSGNIIIETPLTELIFKNNSIRPFMHQHISFLSIPFICKYLCLNLTKRRINKNESSALMIFNKNKIIKMDDNQYINLHVYYKKLSLKITKIEKFFQSHKYNKLYIYGLSSLIYLIDSLFDISKFSILDNDKNKVGEFFLCKSGSKVYVQKPKKLDKDSAVLILTADDRIIKKNLFKTKTPFIKF